MHSAYPTVLPSTSLSHSPAQRVVYLIVMVPPRALPHLPAWCCFPPSYPLSLPKPQWVVYLSDDDAKYSHWTPEECSSRWGNAW